MKKSRKRKAVTYPTRKQKLYLAVLRMRQRIT